MVVVLFFIRHFTERGTEVSVYDYALHNEEILHNKSYIVAFSEDAQRKMGLCMDRHSYQKFRDRFEILEIEDFHRDIPRIIGEYGADWFYTQTHGGPDFYDFGNKEIWKNCRTIKHCVFDANCPESDFYCCIGHCINQKWGVSYPVIPYMVSLPLVEGNLRKELGIPLDAIVLGRYGGYDNFFVNHIDIGSSIIESLERDENLYYLFMNTAPFCEPHPRIIHLVGNTDMTYKTKFIQTCDAMLHARNDGETFGLAVAEFSSLNRPVITCNCGDKEHITILGDRALIYNTKSELDHTIKNIRQIITSHMDWNAYENYTPECIMRMFDEMIFSKKGN